jgi:GT2 family glycosyltransferase
MNLSIIIVTHNSRSPVERCLASIEAHPPAGAFEILVIDNASGDGTPDMIAERFASVGLVRNRDNIGYSRGVNQGIRASKGRHLLVLNPDIVVDEGSIDRLVAFLERTPDAGIAASKLVYPDGRLQFSCRRFYNFTVLLLRRTFLGRLFPKAGPLREHLMMDYDHESARKVDWVIGACMLVRREAIERVGYMDERFFLYFEDLDWCYRMGKHGWSVYYVPESVMVHSYERSSAKSLFRKPFLIHLLSMLRYIEKWNRVFYFLRRHRAAIKALLFVFFDIVMINVCFVGAYYLRFLFQPFFKLGLYPMSWYLNFVYFYNLIYFLTFFFSGLYRIRRETSWFDEFVDTAKATLIGVSILMASTYLTRDRIFSRAVVLGQAILIIVAVVGVRQVLRAFHRELVKAAFDLKRVLLVGSGDEVGEITERLLSDPGLGIEVVGFVNDSPESLGTPAEIPEIIERFKVQEVIVLSSCRSVETMLPLLMHSSGRMIQVRTVMPVARFFGSGVRIEEFVGLPMFSMERGIVHLFWKGLKRLADIILSAVILPLSAAAALILFVYGRLTGSIRFHGERREGLGGRELTVPRIILPSGGEGGDLFKPLLFLQVLVGRMSIVGPPPLRASQRPRKGPASIIDYKPGISGRWRSSDEAPVSEVIESEFASLQNWSLRKEFSIMIRSLRFAFSGRYPGWFDTEGIGDE